MKTLRSEKCTSYSKNEIRDGVSSWDDGHGNSYSVKYTWFDKRGRACRGGEVPVEALPQMVKVALKYGYLSKKDFT